MTAYSFTGDKQGTARTMGKELFISPKAAVEICRELRGMKLNKAKTYLKEVVEMKRAVPFKRFVRQVCHKKGMAAGRYPVKAASYILKLLEDVSANAEYQGMDPENMRIIHMSSYMGRTYHAYMPRARGSSSPWDQQTANVEIVVKELE